MLHKRMGTSCSSQQNGGKGEEHWRGTFSHDHTLPLTQAQRRLLITSWQSLEDPLTTVFYWMRSMFSRSPEIAAAFESLDEQALMSHCGRFVAFITSIMHLLVTENGDQTIFCIVSKTANVHVHKRVTAVGKHHFEVRTNLFKPYKNCS